jgi:Ca2+-binding EF-hand superfamily protein
VALLRDLADALSAQRGTLAAMFAEVDADGSVSLDKRELREMITRKLRVELGDSEMQIIWSQLDADGSVRGASW